jgi:hypothetical protein
MSAVDFAHNCPRVLLELRSPVVLTLLNVPRQWWPYHILWVMHGVRRCMHCHECWRAVQSFDVHLHNHHVAGPSTKLFAWGRGILEDMCVL